MPRATQRVALQVQACATGCPCSSSRATRNTTFTHLLHAGRPPQSTLVPMQANVVAPILLHKSKRRCSSPTSSPNDPVLCHKFGTGLQPKPRHRKAARAACQRHQHPRQGACPLRCAPAAATHANPFAAHLPEPSAQPPHELHSHLSFPNHCIMISTDDVSVSSLSVMCTSEPAHAGRSCASTWPRGLPLPA